MYNESSVEPFIIFRIAAYLFALPIGDVLQVVNYPAQVSHELSQLGMIQLGHHMIKVVDLHRFFNSEGFSQVPGSQSFLVITRDPQGEFCGIPVDEPPDLIEFSPEKLRSLSQDERQFGVAKLASHVIVLSWKEVSTTIFRLDLQRALITTSTGSHFLPAKLPT
jgi:purine-binding chemotaxis protein CheW